MARLSITSCLGILTVCLAILAAFVYQSTQQDIMKDSSNLPPWFAFTFGFKAFKLLELFPNWVLPPPVRMVELALGGLHKSQVIVAIDDLGIADALGDSAQTAQQLAATLGIQDADKLCRLLTAAAAFGVLTARQDSKSSTITFHNNALSAVLRNDHPNTVTHTIKGGMRSLYMPFNYIAEGLRQDRVPFDITHGQDMWQYLKNNAEMEHEFSLAMASQDKMGIHGLLTDYDWSQHSKVIDVGAAYGTFLAAMLKQHPSLSGVVCDLSQVVQKAEQQWQSKYPSSMINRTSFVECDFLKSGMLPKADQAREAYVLRDILHDWSDDKVLVILRNLRQAIGDNPSAVVLLVESVLQGITDLSVKYLLDITMLVAVDGKERTEQEFGQLLQDTGFHLKTVHQTRGLYRVVEALPVSS